MNLCIVTITETKSQAKRSESELQSCLDRPIYFIIAIFVPTSLVDSVFEEFRSKKIGSDQSGFRSTDSSPFQLVKEDRRMLIRGFRFVEWFFVRLQFLEA